MYSAFNTVQTELERLIKLKESIETSGRKSHMASKLLELDILILDHQQAVKILLRAHFRTSAKMQRIQSHRRSMQ